MQKRGIDNIIYCLKGSFLFLVFIFASCIDEPFINKCADTTISIKINPNSDSGTRTFVDDDLVEEEGEYPDKIVRTLRILTFDGGNLVGNELYDIINSALDVIQHPVQPGTYDFVFLANEPTGSDFTSISQFSDLYTISYPESAFASDELIPMMQVIKGVVINSTGERVTLTAGTLFDINGHEREDNAAQGLYKAGDKTDLLILRLDRLAVRLNIVLNSKFNMEDNFESLVLSNIPKVVPLFQSEYGNIDRGSEPREYPAEQFKDGETSGDIIWAKKLDRIVLPSNHATSKEQATVLTVKLKDDDKYSPSCELAIGDDNYNLHYNTWLDFVGTMNKPLEVSITAKPWDPDGGDWEIGGIRKLNVSHTSENITDFNGIRISFWSNMPRVRVLSEVEKGGVIYPTNTIFNDLAIADGDLTTTTTTRFSYNPTTGSGYMDIIADGGLGESGDFWKFDSGTYYLTLSAEDENGKNALRRRIKITMTQYGYRFKIDPWKRQYTGVFFRHNEKGERIITAQHYLDKDWRVEVPDALKDWVILSSTPSFDPEAGTDDPGDPEHYPVVPNQYKAEEKGDNDVNTQGRIVKGKGRIYFRVGLKRNHVESATADPKYGAIQLTYWEKGVDANNQPYEREVTTNIYIREGEAPDFLYRAEDPVTDNPRISNDFEPFIGSSQKRAAVKFSPYNLTAPGYRENTPDVDFIKLGERGGDFVKYPTQGGAYFQWAVDEADSEREGFQRAAYNPAKRTASTNWVSGDLSTRVFWKPADGSTNYSEVFETCPENYRRPTDGYVDRISYNGYYQNLPNNDPSAVNHYTDIFYSEMRSSLFKSVYAGNANPVADYATMDPPPNPDGSQDIGPGTFPEDSNSRDALPGTAFGFYADGFYDRRPMRNLKEFPLASDESVGDEHFCTAGGTSYIAYPGTLFFNEYNNASLFIPAAGRLDGQTGIRQFRAQTGYYWSSSVGPSYSEEKYGAKKINAGSWNYEISYYWMMPVLNYVDFGNTIRCVVNTSEPTPPTP